VAACGDDTVIGARPNKTGDASASGGQGGSESGGGGGSSVDGSANGGRSATGGRASSGGVPGRTPCTNSLACGSQVCDRAAGYCVDCVSDADCTTAGLRCVGQHCRPPCTSDRQCTPQGLLCNVPLGVCTECTTDADCGAMGPCQVGNCVGTPTGTGGTGGASNGGAGGAGGASNGGAGGVANGGAGGASNGGAGGVANGGAGGVSNGGAGGVANGGAGGVSSGGTAGSGGAPPLCNRSDLWIALDKSGSMGDAFASGTKWDAARDGVRGFATTATRTAAGVVTFPKVPTGVPASCCSDADCGAYGPCTIILPCAILPLGNTCAAANGCQPSSYDQADLPLTPLPDQSNAFATFLGSVTPSGGSSLAPALERMRTRAVASAIANPSNGTAIVLLTDGAPSGCTANTIPDVANIAAAARAGSPSIKTYVITVGIDPATMEPVATAGGTTIFGTSTTATLAEAADYIRASLTQIAAAACR
jgi:hypothetical protein